MKHIFLFALLVLTFITLVACSVTSPAPVLKTSIPTAVVVSPVPITAVPPATVPPTAVPPTATVPPTVVLPTAALPTPTALPAIACQDQVTFKGEELPKDYAQFAPQAPFVKQWSIYNTGTCTWDSSYNWVFISGDQMTGANLNLVNAINVTDGIVPPSGKFATMSIKLTAPSKPGTYVGYWGLRDGRGNLVPMVGGTKEHTVYVLIVVTGGNTTVGGITNAAVRIVLEQGSGVPCTNKSTYFVYFDMTSNGPTSAKYEISATDASGQVADGVFDTFASPYVSDALKFSTAEKKTVALRLSGPYVDPDTLTIRARVNGGDWQQAQVACK
ncbi:MAG: hypothetical protein HZB51_03540 [Chloroflexi bacterium]|nr:hypothetical protein [Chloroflexota bacterium]